MKKIVVLPSLLFLFISSQLTACIADFTYTISGSIVTFTNTSINLNSENAAYMWMFGNGGSSADRDGGSCSYSDGIYFLTLTVSDSGCTDSKTDTLFINNSSSCNAIFQAFSAFDSNFNILIYNTSAAHKNATFLWDFGDGSPTSNLISPYHHYTGFGAYQLCLTVTDSTCVSSFCDTIGMDANGKMFKQGGFTTKVIDKTSALKNTAIYPVNKPELSAAIYPNPFSSFIHFNSEKSISKVQFYNATGQLIYEGDNIEKQDFSNLHPGIYFLKTDSKPMVKLIKE